MTPRDANHFAQAINAMNAKRTRRADAAVDVLVALVLAILGALALLHYLTPCEAAQLCTLAAVPTRSGWLATARRRLRAAVLRWKLRDLEWAIDRVEEDLADLPAICLQMRREANALRVQLQHLQG